MPVSLHPYRAGNSLRLANHPSSRQDERVSVMWVVVTFVTSCRVAAEWARIATDLVGEVRPAPREKRDTARAPPPARVPARPLDRGEQRPPSLAAVCDATMERARLG